MSITLNSDIEKSLIQLGYEITHEEKGGSSWEAKKLVTHENDHYMVVVTNNVVYRHHQFMEEFILAFTIENSLREVEVRCTYQSEEHLLAVAKDIKHHISKYVAAISDIPEDVESLVLPVEI